MNKWHQTSAPHHAKYQYTRLYKSIICIPRNNCVQEVLLLIQAHWEL